MLDLLLFRVQACVDVHDTCGSTNDLYRIMHTNSCKARILFFMHRCCITYMCHQWRTSSPDSKKESSGSSSLCCGFRLHVACTTSVQLHQCTRMLHTNQ